MAKRFTDNEKWKDVWFGDLEPRYKLFWLYLIDQCDPAGVWEVNKRHANFSIGFEYCMDAVLEQFGKKVTVMCDGRKWWIRSFIDYQYGILCEDSKSKPVMSHIRLLQKHDLWEEYSKGIYTLKDKEEDKEEVKVKAKRKAKAEYTDDFNAWWKTDQKGSKQDAFKNWNACKDKPDVSEIIEQTKLYVAFCKANDRTQRDGAGFITGRLWETEWKTATPKTFNPITGEDE